MSSLLERLAWGTDAGFYRYIPEEVLHPATEEQVQQIIARCHNEHKSITFRAAGTSLSGQACGPSLLVVTGKKWERYEVLENGKAIRMQPGLIGSRVNDILRPYGRRFTPDPASVKSAMVGGIVSNNASGMCCGTHANSYRMLRSARLILADGTILDTGSEESREAFRQSHPEFLKRIEELRDRTLANPELVALIRRKYAIKNVTGLTILPFVEFTDPFDIIAHLMVGAEGTLAFLSEVTMATGEDYPHSASALLLFPTTEAACQCVVALKQSGLPSAVEYFDRLSMRVVEKDFPELVGLPDDAGAELVKLEASTPEELQEKIAAVNAILSKFTPIETHTHSDNAPLAPLDSREAISPLAPLDSREAISPLAPLGERGRGKGVSWGKGVSYWSMRSGIFPAVGATRPVGTTCLIEDIAFPIEHLASATADLQQLFREHNYPDAVIYGHALEGNYHFILNQRFDSEESIAQYENMMMAVLRLVLDKYHGSLKAEHGTGRNMAPFVEREWGKEAYRLMCDVKALFDPENIFNPDVIFTKDEKLFLRHIKPLPEVHPLVDRCIECGFCEVNCVACGFTKGDDTVSLSSRQRVVIMREIARLKRETNLAGLPQVSRGSSRGCQGVDKGLSRGLKTPSRQSQDTLEELERDFAKAGRDLCAGDGLCSTSCPVGINVGEFIHVLRGEAMSDSGKRLSHFAADHFAMLGSGIGSILTMANFGRTILGDKLMQTVCNGLHYAGVPLWTPAIPQRTPSGLTSPSRPLVSSLSSPSGPRKVVYFPSCLNQRLGVDKRAKAPFDRPLIEVMVELLGKAGYEVIFPENMAQLCCGTIWESKGDIETANEKTAELFESLRKASNSWEYPILCDQSPCLHRMREYAKHVAVDGPLHQEDGTLHLYEPVEFIDRYVLERVRITPMDAVVSLHATCSTREMGLLPTLLKVARACAKTVIFPEEIGCCAFAGDKGFTHPELNAWALRKLRDQITKHGVEYGFSNSRTCEIGLTTHSGIQYMNIAYLVNAAATPNQLS